MGLSIHYTLCPPPGLDAPAAHRLVTEARRRSARLLARRGHGEISPVYPAEPGDPWLGQAAFVRRGHDVVGFHVEPRAGWFFTVQPGKDSEPLTLGLADYPATSVHHGRRRRTPRPGWGFHGACKTQYAGLHGWEHFRRCHLLALDLLSIWRRLGVSVEVLDEGDYWPGRDEPALRASLERMNRVVAGLAGAFKDANAEHAPPVQSPIFAHPRFEHLEAEGMASDGPAIRQALAALG